MKRVGVIVFFDHRDSYIHGDINIPEKSGFRFILFFFDEGTTYEEMVRMLIQRGRLLPIDDPRLRYNLVLQAFEASWRGDLPLRPRSLSKPVTLREGQTLASTHLTSLVMSESEFNHYHLNGRINSLFCAASVEIQESPPLKEKSSSVQLGLGEKINFFLTSPGAGIINFTGSTVTITMGLIAIVNWWSKKHSTGSARPQKLSPQNSGSEIMAIRLLMTNGTQPEFGEWLTDPIRLRHYINMFNQPSSSVKPLQAIFALRNGKNIVVDVTEAQKIIFN